MQISKISSDSSSPGLKFIVIPQSERHCSEFGKDTSYLPEAWLNRKNLCIFFLKKPGQISLFLLGLKQPLCWSAPCVTQPPSLWFDWAPGKGHTTEREHPLHPAPSSCSPSTGARFDCLQATKIHRQAGIQFARPSFHPPLVPAACCIHNPMDSFRGSQLSAKLPLLFKTLSWHLCQGHVLAGSTTLASAHLWEAELQET